MHYKTLGKFLLFEHWNDFTNTKLFARRKKFLVNVHWQLCQQFLLLLYAADGCVVTLLRDREPQGRLTWLRLVTFQAQADINFGLEKKKFLSLNEQIVIQRFLHVR